MTREGYCVCGVALNDPLHDGWHKLLWWNGYVFAKAAEQRHKEWEKNLAVHDHLNGRKPADPRMTMDLQGMEAGGKTYKR